MSKDSLKNSTRGKKKISPSKNLTLKSMTTDQFSEEKLKSLLKTEQLGKKICFFPSLESTNLFAKQLAEKGEPHGTLVIAETQTKGQGRLGRSWHSPKGGLWFSLILRPSFRPFLPQHLTFTAGLAAAQTCSRIIPNVSLRWPNDIYVESKKIGGILTEGRTKGNDFEYCIIGIGLNVNLTESEFPSILKSEASSLLILKKEKVEIPLFLANLLLLWENILKIYSQKGFAPVLNSWKKYAHFLGTFVKVDTPTKTIEGEAIDVTLSGSLKVQDLDGMIHEISSGDVRRLTSN